MENERWLPVTGYEGRYEVSDQGNVRSYARGSVRELKPRKHVYGYRNVLLAKDGESHEFTIHRLVMLAFVGERPDGMHINHKSGDKTDNRLCNLEYITHSENIQHSIKTLGNKHGRHHQGKARAILSEDDVRTIRMLKKSGVSVVELTSKFPVGRAQIYNILKGRSWKQESHS